MVMMGSELLHEFAAFEAVLREQQHFLEACGDTGKSLCQTKSAGIVAVGVAELGALRRA